MNDDNPEAQVIFIQAFTELVNKLSKVLRFSSMIIYINFLV